jgi:hypothetical protein
MDGFGAGGPFEGLRALVLMLDPLVDRALEFGDVVEGSSPDSLASPVFLIASASRIRARTSCLRHP